MSEMKLEAEVLLRIEGSDELYSVGTIEVPINLTFGDRPTPGPKPGYRAAVTVDEAGLASNIEGAVNRRERRV